MIEQQFQALNYTIIAEENVPAKKSKAQTELQRTWLAVLDVVSHRIVEQGRLLAPGGCSKRGGGPEESHRFIVLGNCSLICYKLY